MKIHHFFMRPHFEAWTFQGKKSKNWQQGVIEAHVRITAHCSVIGRIVNSARFTMRLLITQTEVIGKGEGKQYTALLIVPAN